MPNVHAPIPTDADGSRVVVTITPEDGEARALVLDLTHTEDGSYAEPAHANLFRSIRREHGREAVTWTTAEDIARPGLDARREARRAAAAARKAAK